MNTLRGKVVALALVAAATAGVALSLSYSAEARMVDPDLDMCSLEQTFSDEFDDLSVAPLKIGDRRWIAHTPWNGDFGDAAFTSPKDGFPFRVENGHLLITAEKGEDGKWRSGLLSSADSEGNGFAQRFGYFEARAKLPPGDGLWPAFWLSAGTAKRTFIEIDAIEHYGRAPGSFNSGLIVWERNPTRVGASQIHTTDVPKGSLYQDFHTYGMRVAPDFITYYFDRRPIWQVKTPPEHQDDLIILVNLALGSGWPIDKAPSPSVMDVDYIKAWRFDEAGREKRCP